MNPYDKEKTRQIWKRVLGEEEESCCRALDSERLREMIAAEKTSACAAMALARCTGRCGEEMLRRLAREKCGHAKKLETVYFLWTGEAACAGSGQIPQYTCPAEGIRQLYRETIAASAQYGRTAEELPEFRALFSSLAEEKRRHGELLRCLLQNYV